MNVEKILSEMTFEEKARFLTGVGSANTYPLERFGVPSIVLNDGPHGVRLSPEDNCTHFPNICNLANSWSRETAYAFGSALADECMEHGVVAIMGPGINMKRHILCGRNFEYFSEDPYLTGELTASYVNGLQEKGVSACVKHFAVNNQEENRLSQSAEIDERTMREIYVRAFEIAIEKSNPASVMCAYNKINGVWCSENPQLLKELLKGELGYEGMVVSDWGAVQNAPRAFHSGLDLQMPENPNIVSQLRYGLDNGMIEMSDIDEAVRRLLTFVINHSKTTPTEKYDRDKQHEIARKIAADGMVLLKNDNDTLPITSEKYKKIAVVGDYAVEALIAGQGSAEVYQSAEYTDSPLEELKKRLPETEFTYVEAYKKKEFSDIMLWPTCASFYEKIEDSDLVVFFAGSMVSEDTENFDRRTARLNQNFEMFMRCAKDHGKKVVLVLQNGGALILGKYALSCDAICDMYLAGEGAGGAVADVLCGIVNPCGKLSETFPKIERRDLEYPGNGMYIEYKERFDIGYRYYDKHPEEIVFPFGHGLSYTSFEYSNICVDPEKLTVSFDLKNVGKCDGAEVVQLYIGDREATVVRPVKELRGFEKVYLKAGESKRVVFNLCEKDLAYYNVVFHKWIAEDGIFDVYVGSSSRDIRLHTDFEYTGNMPYSLKQMSDAMMG